MTLIRLGNNGRVSEPPDKGLRCQTGNIYGSTQPGRIDSRSETTHSWHLKTKNVDSV